MAEPSDETACEVCGKKTIVTHTFRRDAHKLRRRICNNKTCSEYRLSFKTEQPAEKRVKASA